MYEAASLWLSSEYCCGSSQEKLSIFLVSAADGGGGGGGRGRGGGDDGDGERGGGHTWFVKSDVPVGSNSTQEEINPTGGLDLFLVLFALLVRIGCIS